MAHDRISIYTKEVSHGGIEKHERHKTYRKQVAKQM